MIWKIEFEREAEKDLKHIDKQQVKRILKYLYERIASPDDPRRFGEPLQYNLAGLWKYRIGNYRLIAEIQDNVMTVLVVRVGHRKEIYRS